MVYLSHPPVLTSPGGRAVDKSMDEGRLFMHQRSMVKRLFMHQRSMVYASAFDGKHKGLAPSLTGSKAPRKLSFSPVVFSCSLKKAFPVVVRQNLWITLLAGIEVLAGKVKTAFERGSCWKCGGQQ